MALTTDALTPGATGVAAERRVLLDLSSHQVVLDLRAVEASIEVGPPATRWSRYGKRVFDAVVASLLIIATAPLLLTIVIAVRLGSWGPAIYAHDRVGRHGTPFKCLKFRTMVADADAVLASVLAADPALRDEFETTCKLRDDPRITRVGRVLRRTSLDELPQLWNVLRGDMSLVGPRPLLLAEPTAYADELGVVLSVRPGMTGPWQVGGRNDVTYRERIALQASYRDHCTFRGDVVMMLRTVPALLRRDGAY